MLGPLLRTRNLLLVDLRGTGTSSSFTCKALQHWTLLDSIASYTADTGACGRQLNHTRKLIGGHGYVQASDLYTTANAARDLDRVLLESAPARSIFTATRTALSSARRSPLATRSCFAR